jgi:hypothetical protein
MPTYELDLSIDPTDLEILNGNQMNIMVAQAINGTQGNVAWLSFSPFENNTITWVENYGLYASTSSVSNGATIVKMSEVYPAADAAIYSFNQSAVFGPPNTGGNAPAPGTFEIQNDYSAVPSLTFGLCKEATINGNATAPQPINAVGVASAMNATFTPIVTVYVWLQANLNSGTVISTVFGPVATVQYTDSLTIGLQYDKSTGGFVPASSSSGSSSISAAASRKLGVSSNDGVKVTRRLVH